MKTKYMKIFIAILVAGLTLFIALKMIAPLASYATSILSGSSIESSPVKPVVNEGVIQEKYFQSGSVATGVGISAKGEAVVTSSATSDKYIIFVNDKNYTIPKKTWLGLEKGQKVSYQIGFFGIKDLQVLEEEGEK